MRTSQWIALLVVVAIASSGITVATFTALQPERREIERVTLLLNWIPLGDHAPYYVAKELGYWEQNGLIVDIVRGFGSGDTAKKVDVGSAEFGIADTGTVVVAMGRGAKLKVIAMIFDKSPYTLWTTLESGIEDPRDLEGKTVGTPPGDAQRVLFPALAKRLGIDADKVRFVNVAPGAKYSALATGQVDAIFDYFTGKPFVEKAVGAGQYRYWLWADLGVDIYSNALITTEKIARERPDLVRRFVNASLAAWKWTLENPQRAIEIMQKFVPELNKENYLANLRLVMQLMNTDNFKENGIGWISLEKMKRTVELVSTYMQVERPVKPEEVFTNEFLTRYELPPIPT